VLQGEQGNDRIVGGNGNDRVNFSGSFFDYEVSGSTTALTINDLRGPNFGLQDLVLNVEEFSFADGVRTASETLNPVVNPPSANIREVVFIQPIVAANSDGSNQAEFFGTAAQDSGGGTRTTSDLGRIISNGDASGVGNSNRNVIDLYFVERVPGFGDIGNTTANGLAFIGSPGSAIHVGDNLVNFAAGRQTVAEVTAHEIGHNLGLSHVNTRGNLLASSGGGTDLTDSQINTIFRSSLSQPTTTSATSVQVDLPGAEGTTLSGSLQADSSTSLIGGCGGCGVCAACTGGITLS